ncbi:MAG: Clp protease N-terminal domain-containing protein [Acidobacteriota bacterium]
MFERYTERAKRALSYGMYEASLMGHDNLEPEHVLLGLIREWEPDVAAMFDGRGAAGDEIRQAMESRLHRNERGKPPVEIAISRDTRRLLAHAVEESSQLGHDLLACGHLLLGVLRMEGSMAAKLLAERGFAIAGVRADVVDAVGRVEDARRRAAGKAFVQSIARRLGLPRERIVSFAQFHGLAAGFRALLAEVPARLAFVADGGGILVSSLPELPSTLPSWLEGLSLVEHPASASGPLRFTTPSGVAVLFVWARRDVFLLLVADGPVNAERVCAIVREIGSSVWPDP